MNVRSAIPSIAAATSMPPGGSIGAGLPAEVLQDLAQLARIRTFHAGDTVLAAQADIGFVGSVVTGVLRMQETLPDGRQQIVGLLLPDDMFGRVFARVSRFAVEAATDSVLCCYDRASFEVLLYRHPELQHRMLLAISQELEAARDWMLLLANQTVPVRVATFLLLLAGRAAERFDRAPTVEIPIGRRDMAAYLGTTVESISRAIQQMARSGVIRILDNRRFAIVDIQRLHDMAGHRPDEAGLEPRRQRSSA